MILIYLLHFACLSRTTHKKRQEQKRKSQTKTLLKTLLFSNDLQKKKETKGNDKIAKSCSCNKAKKREKRFDGANRLLCSTKKLF